MISRIRCIFEMVDIVKYESETKTSFMSHKKQVDFLYEVKLLNSFFRLHLWEADLGKLSSDISDLEAAIPEVVVKTLKSIWWK